jgi:pyruvate-formate lyase-activating enzyme
MGIRIRAESVLIPQLVDKDEIERIARFISSVDPSIPYRIDAYVPVLTAPWRRPQREEVLEAVKEARKYLENVSYISSDMEPEGIVLNIYPQL